MLLKGSWNHRLCPLCMMSFEQVVIRIRMKWHPSVPDLDMLSSIRALQDLGYTWPVLSATRDGDLAALTACGYLLASVTVHEQSCPA